MLRIRLRRMGKKHKPFYRIVVSDSRKTPKSKFNDVLGYYDPTVEPNLFKIELGKMEEWVKNGAQPSEKIKKLIARFKKEESKKAEDVIA